MFLIMCCVFYILCPTLMNFWISLLFSTLFISMKIMGECKISGMKYFIFQELSTWLSLFMLIYGIMSMLPLIMIMKMGLPPLHGWVIYMIKKLDQNVKWLMVSSKLLPMTISMSFYCSFILPMMVMLCSTIFFLSVSSLKEIFIMSSGYNLSWGLITHSEIFLFSLLYVFFYLIYLESLMEFSKSNSPIKFLDYLVVLGLPPSGFFFMKLIMVSFYSQHFILLCMMLLSLLFLLTNYLKLLEKISFSKNMNYLDTVSDKGMWFSLMLFPIMTLYT